MFVIDHFRFREASQRTTRELEEECPGSEAEVLVGAALGRGGKSFATQRSPWGEGVKR